MNNNEINFENVSIIFSSCDAYKILWDDFFRLFKKYMPEIKCNIYGTVSYDYSFDCFNIKGNNYHGKDQSFSTRLIKTLKMVKTDYVLFFLDDFYLTDYTDTEFLMKSISLINNNKKIKNIILKDFISAHARCDLRYNEDFMICRKKAPFRCTTQVSLFEKKYLLSLLRRGESAWDFEMIGSYRAMKKNKLVLYRDDIHHNCFSYFDAGYVHKGCFNPLYDDFANTNNLIKHSIVKKIDPKRRTTKSNNLFARIIRHIKYDLDIFNDTIYPFLSTYFTVFRKKTTFFPKYIHSLNRFPKSEEMK